jgi:hypothetical protein
MNDHLCGNHSRNLPIAAFNRLFEAHMKPNYGEALKAAIKKSGGHARLEPSGPPLLRSMCKLGHKGDEPEVRLWLEENYPELGDAKICRAEQGPRQDWALEVGEKLYLIVEALLKCTVKTLVPIGALPNHIFIFLPPPLKQRERTPGFCFTAAVHAAMRSLRACVRHHVGLRLSGTLCPYQLYQGFPLSL